jgi:hypothetical protein
MKHDSQRTYNATLRRVRANTVAVESNKYCIFRAMFVALVILHAMLMHHIVIQRRTQGGGGGQPTQTPKTEI